MERLKEFEENIIINKNYLINIIASKIRNKSDAVDIFQRACIKMWKKYDQFDKQTNFMAWASTISIFEVKNYNRTYYRCPVNFDSTVFDVVGEKLKTSTETEKKFDLIEKLNKAINKLDEVSRYLITSVYMNNEDIKALAEKDGKSPQTYYNKLNLAKKKLKLF
jgi:RNA polymerase sigma-70 factor (ECF subfamily)